MKDRHHLILAAVALAISATPAFSAISFTDQFHNSNWETAAGGFAPNPGGWKDIASNTGSLANDWEYVDGWGDVKLFNDHKGSGTDALWSNDGGTTVGTGTGQVLGIRKGGYVYRKFSTADVVGGSVTLKFDFWFSTAAAGSVALNYALFDELPSSSSNANAWVTGESYFTEAGAPSLNGSVDETVDVSGYANGDFYLAIQQTGNFWETLGIDNVSVTSIPEPSAAALLGLAGLMLGRRRRVRCPV